MKVTQTKIREIWQAQADLNEISHPYNYSTLEKMPVFIYFQMLSDYELAIHAEVQELIECFYWKHWSKEAKQFLRWKFISKEAEQNAKVELVDIMFFLISIMQLNKLNLVEVEKTWTKHCLWEPSKSQSRIGEVICRGINMWVRKVAGIKNPADCHILAEFIAIAANLVTREEIEDLYFKKLQINIDRQKRGRKQVGDEYSNAENQTVK